MPASRKASSFEALKPSSSASSPPPPPFAPEVFQALFKTVRTGLPLLLHSHSPSPCLFPVLHVCSERHRDRSPDASENSKPRLCLPPAMSWTRRCAVLVRTPPVRDSPRPRAAEHGCRTAR